jgi:uncharacterized protein
VIVVSDTSPITNLTDVGQLHLLHLLFGRVIIPPAVSDELERGRVSLPEWIEVSDVQNSARVEQLENEDELDRGEAEALVLALELKADRLLIDEELGRAVAERMGLRYLGLLGVLLDAKRRGHLIAVRPVIDDLVSVAGFWMSEELRREVLDAAGERE